MPIREVGSVTLSGAANNAKTMLPQARQSALKAIGVQLLSWTWIAYRDKARGKSDFWGIAWKPITKFAIAGRLLKRAAGRAVRAMMPSGSSFRTNRAAILAMAIDGQGPQSKNGPTPASKKRDRVLKAFSQKVDAEYAKHEIGVDTGRLVNSIQFGKPNNVVQYADTSVLVGTNLEYAGLFDAKRPIFPSDINADQKKQLETLVSKVYELSLKKGLGA